MTPVGETLPNQQSRPSLWDITFASQDQFKVEIAQIMQDLALMQEVKNMMLSDTIDGYLIRELPPCDCPLFEVMNSGCQCGGR